MLDGKLASVDISSGVYILGAAAGVYLWKRLLPSLAGEPKPSSPTFKLVPLRYKILEPRESPVRPAWDPFADVASDDSGDYEDYVDNDNNANNSENSIDNENESRNDNDNENKNENENEDGNREVDENASENDYDDKNGETESVRGHSFIFPLDSSISSELDCEYTHDAATTSNDEIDTSSLYDTSVLSTLSAQSVLSDMSLRLHSPRSDAASVAVLETARAGPVLQTRHGSVNAQLKAYLKD